MIEIHGTNGTLTFESASDANAIKINHDDAVIKVKYNDSDFWEKLDEYYYAKQLPEEWHTVSASTISASGSYATSFITDEDLDKAFLKEMDEQWGSLPHELVYNAVVSASGSNDSSYLTYEKWSLANEYTYKVPSGNTYTTPIEPVISDILVETRPQPKFQYHRDGD